MVLNFESLAQSPRPVDKKLTQPRVEGAELAVLWVGHATALIQIEDKFVLTDPVFTETVGQLSRRLVEPGLEPEHLPPLDAVLISHMHFDHLSLGSLDVIEDKIAALIVPKGGAVYIPRSRPLPRELATWQSFEQDGLRVTAVPVGHSGWRYAGDRAWMTTSYTGYVVEYRGKRVYFGGDSSYVPQAFAETQRRFGTLDVALLPIAPIEPRDFMCRSHMDVGQALAAFDLLGARWMMPIHFDTFVNSLDDYGEAPRRLQQLAAKGGYQADAVVRLRQGERRVLRWLPDPPDVSNGVASAEP